MADPLSEIEQIRARHNPDDDVTSARPYCVACEVVWPCDASLLLAALSAYEDKFNAMDDDVRRVYAKRDAALARLEALEGAAREMLKPFSDQLRARVALAAAIEAERG